jgi:uncharacterized protein YbjQ (UPF0145 family)
MEPIGKIAYEAYRERFAEEHPAYREWFSNHEWDAMDQPNREAWQQAAAAVLRLNDEQHKSAAPSVGERAMGEGSVFRRRL